MTDSEFSSWLLGRMHGMEQRLAQHLESPAAAAPAPVPEPKEPSAADQNAHFLLHVEEIAGRKPEAATAAPEVAPKTLSRSSPRYARDFARWAEAIADGRCGIVD